MMKWKTRSVVIGVAALSIYGVAYLCIREKDVTQLPFYVTIRYGEERLAVRCVNTNFVADAADMVTAGRFPNDPEFNPLRIYNVSVSGSYVTMNRHDSRNLRRVFRPLEWVELGVTRVGPKRANRVAGE
jgi:hypothetical protein